ncbi:MAG: hypothetical protein R2875_18830 [Desulfobacterales bacterium]
MPNISGATILGRGGRVVPILNVNELIASLRVNPFPGFLSEKSRQRKKAKIPADC